MRKSNKQLPDDPTLTPHQRAARAAGGALILGVFAANLARNLALDLKTYSPGCGSPTFVAGTNGGQMPCGAKLTALDGTTTPYWLP